MARDVENQNIKSGIYSPPCLFSFFPACAQRSPFSIVLRSLLFLTYNLSIFLSFSLSFPNRFLALYRYSNKTVNLLNLVTNLFAILVSHFFIQELDLFQKLLLRRTAESAMAGCLLAATNRSLTASPSDPSRPQSSLKRKRQADNSSAALILLANKQSQQQQSKLDSKCKFHSSNFPDALSELEPLT